MFYFFLCLISNHRPTCYLDIFGMPGNTLTKITVFSVDLSAGKPDQNKN